MNSSNAPENFANHTSKSESLIMLETPLKDQTDIFDNVSSLKHNIKA